MLEGQNGIDGKISALDVLHDAVQDLKGMRDICLALHEYHNETPYAYGLLSDFAEFEAERIELAGDCLHRESYEPVKEAGKDKGVSA